MSDNGSYHAFDFQVTTRTLEVLYPFLERAAESAPFDDNEVNTELANFRNRVRCRLIDAGVNIE